MRRPVARARSANRHRRSAHAHQLHRTRRPTVVVDQGASNFSVLWAHLHERLAAGSRVCLYDRGVRVEQSVAGARDGGARGPRPGASDTAAPFARPGSASTRPRIRPRAHPRSRPDARFRSC